MVSFPINITGVQTRLSYRGAWDLGSPGSQPSINGSPGGAQRVAGLVDDVSRRPPSRMLRQHEDIKRVCVWGESEIDVGTMWGKLARVCNNGSVLKSVQKIEAVKQQNGRTRFDIYCVRAWESTLMNYIKRHATRLGWYARGHIPWEERRKMDQQAHGARPARMVHKQMRLGSYNINGIKSKRFDVERVLQVYNLDCLAIQETKLTAYESSLRFQGYHCFQVCGSRSASQRGIALALRKTWSGYVVGTSTSWFLFVRVFGRGMTHPMIIGCIYLPHRDRTRVVERFKAEVLLIQQQYPSDQLIVMGDWNEDLHQSTMASGLGQEWGVLPQDVSAGTRQGSNRTIDFMISNRRQDLFEHVKVHRNWDFSDHYPLTTRIKWEPQEEATPPSSFTNWEVQQPRRRFHVDRVPLPKPNTDAQAPEEFLSIVDNNYWDPLLATLDEFAEEEPSADQLNRLARDFCDTAVKVANESGITSETTPLQQTAFPRHIARAIDKRCKAYKATKDANLSAERRQEMRERYLMLKARCRRIVRKFQQKRWRKMLKRAEEDFKVNPHKYWRWASRLAGWKRKASCTGAQPIKHPVTGELLTEAQSINDAWRLHYANLAEDSTGHSRESIEYWNGRLGLGPCRRPLQELNEDITRDEMLAALRHIKNRKAPGKDGIPAEFFKLLVHSNQPSKLGDVLFGLLQWQWSMGFIPDIWRESVVVSIPKKGDLTDANNYRGISLMSTALKVLIVILTRRLNRAFEAHDLFSPSQAGFRTREECVTQVGCLLEICQRRKIDELPTYLAFVDIRKAYDTVPHGALFAKLAHYGVTGKMMTYIQALYASSDFTIRTGDAPFDFSEPAPLRRGVRQGCPMSPVLFNIFINDIFDGGSPHLGVQVPGSTDGIRVPGLLFADDAVVMASTAEELGAALSQLSDWLDRVEMTASPLKCGAMVIGPEELHDQFASMSEDIVLQGESIPIVDNYRYLGINFRNDLDIQRMVDDRLDTARRTVSAVTPFLRSRSIPLYMRALVTRVVVLPILLFGAEIYGMNKKLTSKMQRFLNHALRAMAGASSKSPVSNVALWREFRMPPICASAAARRTRAIRKCATLRSWVKSITDGIFRTRKWTWYIGTIRWLRRFSGRLGYSAMQGLTAEEFISESKALLAGRFPESGFPDAILEYDGWNNITPRTVVAFITLVVWMREERVFQSRTGHHYISSRFMYNRICQSKVGCEPGIALGMNTIVLCRLGALWTAHRRARRGLIHPRYLNECPCCHNQEPETLFHLLWNCPRWAIYREAYLEPLRPGIEVILTNRDDSNFGINVVVLLLGGEVRGESLPGWLYDQSDQTTVDDMPDDEADDSSLDEQDSDLDSPRRVTLEISDNASACLRVALYFSYVIRARAPVMSALRRLDQCTFSTSGRSPDG